jgi:hypothetical protein
VVTCDNQTKYKKKLTNEIASVTIVTSVSRFGKVSNWRKSTSVYSHLAFRPFFLPIRPIESPFFARAPSPMILCPMSRSNAPLVRLVARFEGFVFALLTFLGRFSCTPIFVGLAAFLAERIAASMAPVLSSSSAANFRLFARLVRPANLSLLGCRDGH